MVFRWTLNDSKSPEVSRTFLSILAVLNNAVVLMVSTHLPTSNSSTHFNNPLVTVTKVPITIGIIVTFMLHSFFQFSRKVKVLIFLFGFCQFYSVVCRDSKVDYFASYYYYYIYSFSHQRLLMIFHLSLGDSKSPQVSRTLLSILADLSNAVVWMVSGCSPISNCFILLTKPLGKTNDDKYHLLSLPITF